MFNKILIIFSIIIICIFFWLKSREPVIFGKFGEFKILKRLRTLNPDHYIILNDLLIPSAGEFKTSQIDHVIISNYGIFCIETKAYAGWIFGDANQKYWTQVIFKYKKKFYNPLWQNYGHVKALEQIIKPFFPNITIIPLVVFTDSDKLKISGTELVCRKEELMDIILDFTEPVLSDDDVRSINRLLSEKNIKDKAILKDHNQAIRIIKGSD